MRFALFFLFLSQYFWLCLASDFSLLPPFGVASWSVGGDAKFTSGYIRLAEDRQSKTGWLWNDLPNVYSAWEVVFEFRIHGVSRVGADGMAFWYTSQSKISGSVLGNQENFKGLGILIDTYDNDNSGMHPFLAVLVNDGTKPFIHDHEKGEGHNDSGAELGGCSVAVRNLQHTSRVKVIYNNNVLTISTALDGSSDFKTCVETADIELSPGWFFGFTAATGHLADNHDLYSVVIRNLGAPIVTPQGGGPSNRAEGASDVIKILSNIQHQVHGIQTQDREHTVSSQKHLQSRLDKLSTDVVSLRNYLADMDVYLRDFLEKPKPNVAAATADPAGNRLFNDLANNVARQFEKFEKDQARKIQDLRSILSSSNDQGKTTERGYAEWLLWLIFGSVLLFGGLMTIAQIRRSQRRQKKYF